MDALLELPGVLDVLPAYDSTLVEHLPETVSGDDLLRAAEAAGAAGDALGRLVEVPVAYGGEHGPDLAEVAARAGLPAEAAAALHASAEYEVRAVGFSPGFPYLAGLPPALAAPRRPEPRRRVPAHSVGIAMSQSGVYPVASPGGWNLVGRTLTAVYDPHREEPFLLAVGDRVRFVPAPPGRRVAPPPDPEPLELLPGDPALPVFEVVASGLLDLVVDRGRRRAGRFGLARGGPLDAPAARLANLLVGNDPWAPVLEMTMTGPALRALAGCLVAVTGPALAPRVDGAAAPSHQGFVVAAGGELRFVPTGVGARSYLAVAGGFEARPFLGSVSVDLRGLVGRPLRAGDVLGRARPAVAIAGRRFEPHGARGWGEGPFGRVARVRLLPGPQHEPDAWQALLSGEFEVEAADRVGLRLAGGPVPGGEVRSEGVPIGAVQVPPAGRPIVLLADRGTLGGYAKPALVHPDDLPRLAQLRTGDRLRFVVARGGR
ncbi:MAG TPA: 5-oxoprolinase subunit PxpB [Trueperaceae bacterium]|nr:5-oxoprolinase subunit PxpB [Trueperaceae bacterium]